jgi:predicted small lipoprotein YifL
MPRVITLLTATMVLSATLSGCGLAGTSVAGAAAGASEVEQARHAKETEARAQKQVDAAVQLDADRRKAAETESQ